MITSLYNQMIEIISALQKKCGQKNRPRGKRAFVYVDGEFHENEKKRILETTILIGINKKNNFNDLKTFIDITMI